MLRLERRRTEQNSFDEISFKFLPFYRDKRSFKSELLLFNYSGDTDEGSRAWQFLPSTVAPSFSREKNGRFAWDDSESGEKVFRDQRSEIKRQQRGIRWNNGIGGEEGGGERGKHRDWDVVKILYTSWKGMLTVKFKWRRSTGFMVVVYLIAVSLVAFHSVFHRGTINERKNARSENKIIIVKR